MKITKLLLIDDDEIQAFIVEKLVSKLSTPVQLSAVFNGREGLDFLGACTGDSFPDAILLDLNMPILGGFDFLEIYQHRFYELFRGSQIYVFTSSARSVDRERAVQYGSVADYYIKPIDLSTLSRIVGQSAS